MRSGRRPLSQRRTKWQRKKQNKKTGLVGKTTGVGVCQTWLVAFGKKELKTATQITKFMHKQFPGRDSEIFNYPNVVVGRANRGLLDGKKHSFKKYFAKQLDKTKV